MPFSCDILKKYSLKRSGALLWTHLNTKVAICIVERALSDIQLNCCNKCSWLRLLSFKIILAALVCNRSNALYLEGAK